MMDLTGFQPFDFSIGSPSVTITNRGVTFNQATVKRLNMVEYVQVLINHEEGQVAATKRPWSVSAGASLRGKKEIAPPQAKPACGGAVSLSVSFVKSPLARRF